jgi:cytochrome P450
LGERTLPIGVASGILDIPMALPYVWLITRYFRRLFAERRARPGDDLLSALVQAEEAGDRLDEDELLGIAILLLAAGYETTVHLIGSAVLALLQHPDQRARFVTEPGLTHSAIEELLRYTSPAEMTTPRIAREDVTLSSVTIPRGAWVIAVLGSANRDESVFRDPRRSPSLVIPTRTWHSARAVTSAWARAWPAWKRRSPSPPSSRAFPACA